MPKILRVGIYRLLRSGDDPPRSLIDVARIIQNLQAETRARTLTDDPIRPRDNFQITPLRCIMDFTRIRQIDQLPTSNVKGEEGSIPFGPQDKKPCENTAVLLDHHCNVIYVQERMGEISHAMIAKYFAAIGGIEKLTPQVAIQLDGLMRLDGKEPSAIKIKLAGIDDATYLGRQGYGDGAIASLLQRFNAPNATITLGLEPSPGRLQGLLDIATEILTWNGRFRRKKPVKELSIWAEDGEHNEEFVNLLKDRMIYREEIELEGREPTDAERYRAVTNAWIKYGPGLRERYTVSQAD